MNKKVEGLSFDTAFGEGGFVNLNNPGNFGGAVEGIKILADGSLIALTLIKVNGESNKPALVKISENGELVDEFGDGGCTDINFLEPDVPWGMVSATLTSDEQKFFVLAQGKSGFEWRLVCLDANGHQDMAFGRNGVVVIRADVFTNEDTQKTVEGSAYSTARTDLFSSDKTTSEASNPSVAPSIDVDDKGILVTMTPAYGEARVYSLIRRYTYQGELDKTFGDNGSGQIAIKGYADAPDRFESLVVTRGVISLSDGYLVYGNMTPFEYVSGASRGFVKKLDLTGKAYEGFGKEGYVLLPSTYDGKHIPYVGGLMVDSEGRIVGYTGVSGLDDGAGLFRLSMQDGVFDGTFHGSADFHPEGTAVIGGIYEDDEKRLVVCGNAFAELSSPKPFVARWTPDGDVDSSFGEKGWLPFPSTEATAIYSLSLQDGQALIGGNYRAAERKGFLARMLPFDDIK